MLGYSFQEVPLMPVPHGYLIQQQPAIIQQPPYSIVPQLDPYNNISQPQGFIHQPQPQEISHQPQSVISHSQPYSFIGEPNPHNIINQANSQASISQLQQYGVAISSKQHTITGLSAPPGITTGQSESQTISRQTELHSLGSQPELQQFSDPQGTYSTNSSEAAVVGSSHPDKAIGESESHDANSGYGTHSVMAQLPMSSSASVPTLQSRQECSTDSFHGTPFYMMPGQGLLPLPPHSHWAAQSQELQTSAMPLQAPSESVEDQQRDHLYRTFAEIIKAHGSLEVTDQSILNVFIKLTANERKRIMVHGSIRAFLSCCPYIEVNGNTVQVKGDIPQPVRSPVPVNHLQSADVHCSVPYPGEASSSHSSSSSLRVSSPEFIPRSLYNQADLSHQLRVSEEQLNRSSDPLIASMSAPPSQCMETSDGKDNEKSADMICTSEKSSVTSELSRGMADVQAHVEMTDIGIQVESWLSPASSSDDTVTKDLYEATLLRARQAEERVVLLQKELCTQILKHYRDNMQDKYIKLLANPSNSDTSILPQLIGAMRTIEDETLRIQTLNNTNISALRDGKELKSLREISLDPRILETLISLNIQSPVSTGEQPEVHRDDVMKKNESLSMQAKSKPIGLEHQQENKLKKPLEDDFHNAENATTAKGDGNLKSFPLANVLQLSKNLAARDPAIIFQSSKLFPQLLKPGEGVYSHVSLAGNMGIPVKYMDAKHAAVGSSSSHQILNEMGSGKEGDSREHVGMDAIFDGLRKKTSNSGQLDGHSDILKTVSSSQIHSPSKDEKTAEKTGSLLPGSALDRYSFGSGQSIPGYMKTQVDASFDLWNVDGQQKDVKSTSGMSDVAYDQMLPTVDWRMVKKTSAETHSSKASFPSAFPMMQSSFSRLSAVADAPHVNGKAEPDTENRGAAQHGGSRVELDSTEQLSKSSARFPDPDLGRQDVHPEHAAVNQKNTEADETNPLLFSHKLQGAKSKSSDAGLGLSEISLVDGVSANKVVDEHSGEWQQVGKKHKKLSDQIDTNSAESFEKMLQNIQASVPKSTRQDVVKAVQEVRQKHGKLKGLDIKQIKAEAISILKEKLDVSSHVVSSQTKESDHVSDMGSKMNEGGLLYKTAICTYWQQGICKRTAKECVYAHGKDDLRPLPKNIMCQNMATKGTCPYGDKCLFAHSKEEMRKAQTK